MHGDAQWFAEYARGVGAGAINLADGQAYVPIRIGDEEGTPLAEVGLVATHADVLKASAIPILYHCTYSNDFALVPEAQLPRAVAAFREAGAAVDGSDAWSRAAACDADAPPG